MPPCLALSIISKGEGYSGAILGMVLRPPLHDGVVAIEKRAFGSPSTMVANFFMASFNCYSEYCFITLFIVLILLDKNSFFVKHSPSKGKFFLTLQLKNGFIGINHCVIFFPSLIPFVIDFYWISQITHSGTNAFFIKLRGAYAKFPDFFRIFKLS